MGRLPTLLLLMFVFAVLAVARVSTDPAPSGAQILIAVPNHVPMDREPNLFVFTAAPGVMVEVPFQCFYRAGVYESRQLASLDKTGGEVGPVDAVITQRSVEQEILVAMMFHPWDCNVSGENYRVYEAVTGGTETRP